MDGFLWLQRGQKITLENTTSLLHPTFFRSSVIDKRSAVRKFFFSFSFENVATHVDSPSSAVTKGPIPAGCSFLSEIFAIPPTSHPSGAGSWQVSPTVSLTAFPFFLVLHAKIIIILVVGDLLSMTKGRFNIIS